jgi:ubiquinone/menaquinone biosynthesis C-methylase UbiE
MKDELKVQRDYWDKESDEFDSIYGGGKGKFRTYLDKTFRRDMYDRFLFTLQESAPIESRTFLDVGCGSGLYSVELAKRGARHVTGLDIAPSMLTLCQRRAERESVTDRCTFLESDLLAYQSSGQSDVTIGIGLFDYIRDPLPVLKAMRRVTSAHVILSFPRLWTWRAPIRRLRLLLRGCASYYYTRQKVSRLLREAGFEKMRIVTVGKLHCVVAS